MFMRKYRKVCSCAVLYRALYGTQCTVNASPSRLRLFLNSREMISSSSTRLRHLRPPEPARPRAPAGTISLRLVSTPRSTVQESRSGRRGGRRAPQGHGGVPGGVRRAAVRCPWVTLLGETLDGGDSVTTVDAFKRENGAP